MPTDSTVGSAPLLERPGAGAAPGDAAHRWFGLSVFAWIQLLLVLWLVATEFIRIAAGVDFFPFAPAGWRLAPPGPAELLLHAFYAAIYPVAALLLSRRIPLWQRPAQHVALHVGALLLLHAAVYLGSVMAVRLGLDPLHGWTYFGRKTLEFALVTAFAHGMIYGERYQAKEQEELRLRAEVAESRAERMRAHMRSVSMEWTPDFLSGTLGAIRRLLAHDVARAKRLLLGVSSVLRHVLSGLRSDVVRLEQEVELVREVLEVEALRRSGLTAEWEIDEEALDLPLPPMTLVRLVHQALAECTDECRLRIRISAAEDGTAAHLRVDTPGLAGGGATQRLASAGAGAREIRVAPEEARGTGSPRSGVGAASASRPPLPGSKGEPPIGRWLELGTYAILILLCAVQGLNAANLDLVRGTVALQAPSWLYVIGSGLYAALWWGSLAFAAHQVASRFHGRGVGWARVLGWHAAGVVAVSLLNAVAYAPFQRYVVAGGGVWIGIFSPGEWGDLAAYLPLAGIAHGFVYARRYRIRRVAELRLRAQLSQSELQRAEAELQALKAELNPHFLFNALNTVSSLMHTRVDVAQRVVSQLSLLLHRVLESSGLHDVSVEEELDFIRLYVQIEQARFGDALQVDYRPDPETLRARIPHMLLQPLVENAVKHGLRPRGGTGRVTISARRDGRWLQLAVVDDGVGPGHASPAEGTGSGLVHVRQRLRQSYGDEFHFELAAAPQGGTAAVIRIPFSERVARSSDAETATTLSHA